MVPHLSEAQSRHVLILGTPLVMTSSAIASFSIGGLKLAIPTLVVITIALLSVAWLLRPRWWGSTRVQALSVTVLGALAMAVIADMFWLPTLVDIYERLRTAFPETLPSVAIPTALHQSQRVWTLVTLSVAFVALNYIWTRHNTLPPTDLREDGKRKPFPQHDYAYLRNEFTKSMLTRLDQYDADLNWSDAQYTALEAQVELDRYGTRRRQIRRDLVSAIRRDQTSRSFLLLGDPGSGKSVSLRRLCRELCKEVEKTGVVPVYVNLREWDGPDSLNDNDIASFIHRYIKRDVGRHSRQFLNKWYEPMLDHGRFFFILDSFDEMPPVLDCDDASPQIKEISRAFDRFFSDIHHCRGILASRRFRQPRGFRGRRILICPFNESQIRRSISRWLRGQSFNTREVVREVFRQPGLASAVRNPFLADLVVHHIIYNNGTLPANHFAIYEDYIKHRLDEDANDLQELSVKPDELTEAAAKIAWVMYNESDTGSISTFSVCAH